jgi:DNA helicase IV
VRAREFEAEQAHIDAAYIHLDRMRARAERLLADMQGGDPDLVWALLRRVRSLAPSPRALCFGRIDMVGGETWHIGRRHVDDEDGDPWVIEWRTPVAVPFYRARAADPRGVELRRQFVAEGPKLLSIGDDYLGGAAPEEDTGVRGRDALLIELDRARSGQMVDIVATIQPEQDEVIRAPAAGVMAVQGGPGSGKTAVGLHRAAFLLYGDDDLARANVLVVGPTRTFLRYIGQVLPSLGEQAVVQTTFTDLVPEVELAAVDAPALLEEGERVKGDGRMATVLARALDLRRRAPTEGLAVGLGVRRLSLDVDVVSERFARSASRSLPYADGRSWLRDLLVQALVDRLEEITGVPSDDGDLPRRLRSAPELKTWLDRCWPSVSPTALVRDLLTRPAVLAAAAEGVLDDAEQRSLRRRRGQSWTPADAPLVDEAKALIAGYPRRYGHAIVDEAQDVTPMQLRMLARRCPHGSLTLLGDLAQAISPWGLRAWDEVQAWLPTPDGLRVVELRTGYRSPAEVLELAGRLLPEAAPQVRPSIPVRRGRSGPRLLRVGPGAVVEAVAGETAALAREWATVAVIVTPTLVTPIIEALSQHAGIKAADARSDGLGQAVTVVDAEAVKGLEFDAVVVVEPAAIARLRPRPDAGLRLLYVALTRPTQHLSVVHHEDLPAALGHPLPT